MDKGFTRRCQDFVILAQPTVMIEPRESAFNDPSPGQNAKALLVVAAEYNLQTAATVFENPVEEFSSVATIDPDESEFLASSGQSGKQQTGSVPVLNRSGRDDNDE
jgi:hypothetical protein